MFNHHGTIPVIQLAGMTNEGHAVIMHHAVHYDTIR